MGEVQDRHKISVRSPAEALTAGGVSPSSTDTAAHVVQSREYNGSTPDEHVFLVPHALLRPGRVLSPAAIRVYLHLCSAAGERGTVSRQSTSELSRRTGLKQRSVFSAISQLEDAALLRRLRTRRTDVNGYILSHSSAKADLDRSGASTSVQPSSEEQSGRLLESKAAGAANTGYPGLTTLDELIADVYTSKCKVDDLRCFIGFSEADLRSCLERVRAAGGISADMPVSFFAVVLKTIHRDLNSMQLPRNQGNGIGE